VSRLARLAGSRWTRRLLEHLAVALAGVLLAWGIVAYAIFPDRGGDDAVTVPAVTGLRYDDARKALDSLGLQASMGESRPSAGAPKSTVLAQSPLAGERAVRGMRVVLDVSAGQRRATIPPVAGMSRESAAQALREAGLAVGTITERTSPDARGTVLSSQPDAGQVVAEGTSVDLVTSSGPAELSVPDVVGRRLTQVRAIIEQLGLAIGETSYDSTSASATGVILSQSPAPGTLVSPGAAITLRIAGRP
jgi:beta-lactam-binding protein with PASTA domain